MQSGFRVFALMGVSALGLVGMKALSIGDDVFTLLDPAQRAEASAPEESGHDTAKPEMSSHDSAKDNTAHDSTLPNMVANDPKPEPAKAQCPVPNFAEQAGLSEQELRVVMRLSERREELDKRERDLSTREAVVELSEKKLDDRLAKINAAIATYDAKIGVLSQQEEQRMAAVVKTYETMEPKKAARIFDALDETVLLQVATRMKPAKMAEVLAAMDIKRATDLTVKMSEQFDPPTVDELLSSKDQEAKADTGKAGSAG